MNKKLLSGVAGAFLLICQWSFAAVPESCWTVTVPGQEAGHFTVDIDTSQLTKEDIMTDMNRLTENIEVSSNNILFVAKQNWITMTLAPSGISTTYLPDGTPVVESQDHIASRVNPEIKRLMQLPGVSIRCFVHAIHHGGVSLSN